MQWHSQGRLGDHHLMLHMLQNDSVLQNSLDYYRKNYIDCVISCPKTPHKDDAADDRDMQDIVLQHMQTFLFEATTYYLVLGFVVFRFCKLPMHDDILVPLVVPIGDIVWSFGQSNHDGQELLQIPEIDVPMQSAGQDVRYYVYKFRSAGQYFSSESSGVLCRLAHSYRRLVHARDYDLIIRNETLRKTIFIEQVVKPNVSVLEQGTRASDYGELQAIMDYTKKHKATTHSETPPSHDEELKASIMVKRVFVCNCAILRGASACVRAKTAFNTGIQTGTASEGNSRAGHGIHHFAPKHTSKKRHHVVWSRQRAGVPAGIRARNQRHSVYAIHCRSRPSVDAPRRQWQLACEPSPKITVG